MKTLDVFDPPMCCSTGVCGEEVDSNLLRFAADLEWLKAGGVAVRRFSLSQDPQAFMNEPEVLTAVSSKGTQCLPMVVVDGKIVSRGSYPKRDELARLTGLKQTAPAGGARPNRSLPVGSTDAAPAKANCCTPAKSGKSGCCS